MKKTSLFLLIVAFVFSCISLSAQIQTGVFRTPTGNTDYHHFTRNDSLGAAVFINQVAATGPILRLSSGTATANQNVRFTVENNGNLGIGTTTPYEKLSLYNTDTTQTFIQFGNSRCLINTNLGFVIGTSSSGSGMVWLRNNLPLSFGTYNTERMRINEAVLKVSSLFFLLLFGWRMSYNYTTNST